MKTEKLFYETPEALIVPLRPRRVMCQSPVMGINDWEDDGDSLDC